MRFNSVSALLALPLLAAADAPDYQAQFQVYLGQAQGYVEKVAANLPSPSIYDHDEAATVKAGSNVDVIGLHNWKETLYGPVTSETTTPEEWWVLITGGKKTCGGHCGKPEAAFNETAARFATEPNSPHMALLNCDYQPILCNAWSVPVSSLWIFEMLPEPAPIKIYSKRMNLTTSTAEDLAALENGAYKSKLQEQDNLFHPFNGVLAQNNMSIPAGYLIWVFGLIPSWAFMIIVSFLSRRMMASRMEGQMQGQMQGGLRAAPNARTTAPRR